MSTNPDRNEDEPQSQTPLASPHLHINEFSNDPDEPSDSQPVMNPSHPNAVGGTYDLPSRWKGKGKDKLQPSPKASASKWESVNSWNDGVSTLPTLEEESGRGHLDGAASSSQAPVTGVLTQEPKEVPDEDEHSTTRRFKGRGSTHSHRHDSHRSHRSSHGHRHRHSTSSRDDVENGGSQTTKSRHRRKSSILSGSDYDEPPDPDERPGMLQYGSLYRYKISRQQTQPELVIEGRIMLTVAVMTVVIVFAILWIDIQQGGL